MTMLLVIGFASAHLSQNEQADTSIVEEPDNDRYVCLWDFGDGSEVSTGDTVTHTFDKSGEYKRF